MLDILSLLSACGIVAFEARLVSCSWLWSKGSSKGQAQLIFCRFWLSITNSPQWDGRQGRSLVHASAVRIQELLAALCHPVKQKRMLVYFNILCWEGPGTALWAVISAATVKWRWWVLVSAVLVSLSLLLRQTPEAVVSELIVDTT